MVSVLDLKDAILFLQGLHFFVFYCVLQLFLSSTFCMCVMYLTSFDGLF